MHDPPSVSATHHSSSGAERSSRRWRLGDLPALPALFASLPRLTQEEAAAFAADLHEARAELNRGWIDPWNDNA